MTLGSSSRYWLALAMVCAALAVLAMANKDNFVSASPSLLTPGVQELSDMSDLQIPRPYPSASNLPTADSPSEWGFNPTTIVALGTVAAFIAVFVAIFLGMRQLQDAKKARDSSTLLELLSKLSDNFLSGESYGRLKERCATLKQVDWNRPLDDDEIRLLKIIRLYAVTGLLVDKGIVDKQLIKEFVHTPLEHHYRDFQPYFVPADRERKGISVLLRICDMDPPKPTPPALRIDHSRRRE